MAKSPFQEKLRAIPRRSRAHRKHGFKASLPKTAAGKEKVVDLNRFVDEILPYRIEYPAKDGRQGLVYYTNIPPPEE